MVVQRGEIGQAGRLQLLAGVEGLLARRSRELVPGADRKAVVAAIDAVAQGFAIAVGDGPLVLDGQVRDAGPRIELEGRGEGIGRADVQARLAGAAVRLAGGVGRQLQVGQHRAQEQPRAVLAGDEVGVLSLPAETGGLGQGFLHQGSGVHEHLHLAAQPGRHPAGKLLQPSLDQLVIVVALGVDRDRAAILAREDLQRVLVGTIAHTQHHRRARVRPHGSRMAPPLERRLHPVHGPVPPGLDELLQPRTRRPRLVDGGETCSFEAQGLGPLADQGFRVVRNRGPHSGQPGPGPAAGRQEAAGTTAGT